MTDQEKLERKWGGLEPWQEDFGSGMEQRGRDGVSWYDLSLLNALPCTKETAIIVTSWAGQLKWLKATLAGYRASGAYVILAYDHHIYPWSPVNAQEMLRLLPNPRHYQLASAVVFKHLTGDAGKRNGWFWDVRYAQGLIRQLPGIKYVYCTNGDCLWEKPEGLPQLLAQLGDADLMSGQSRDTYVHTAAVLYRAEAFHRIIDYAFELMRTPVLGAWSAESMLREAIEVLRLNVGHAPLQPLDPTDGTLDAYARYGQDSTWKQLVGFKNLFAEYETAGNQGLPMAGFRPFVDDFLEWGYWSGEERETICQYWATGDRRYLMQFFDRWEDSDYNRLYYPLTHYGHEPILEASWA